MFVRHLRVGESVGLGDIRITLVKVRGQEARIGIEAPKDVPVRRLEVAAKSIEETVEEANCDWWDDLDESEKPRF